MIGQNGLEGPIVCENDCHQGEGELGNNCHTFYIWKFRCTRTELLSLEDDHSRPRRVLQRIWTSFSGSVVQGAPRGAFARGQGQTGVAYEHRRLDNIDIDGWRHIGDI